MCWRTPQSSASRQSHPTDFRRKSRVRRFIELKSTPPVFAPKSAELLALPVTPPELTGQQCLFIYNPTLTPVFGICFPISHLWAVGNALALRMRGSGGVLLSTDGRPSAVGRQRSSGDLDHRRQCNADGLEHGASATGSGGA